MIVTNDFVMINFPKTGSSFARAVVKRAYEIREARWDRRILREAGLRAWPIRERLCFNPIYGAHDAHGRVEEILDADRNKVVVSVVRDPVERWLSWYNYSALGLSRDSFLPAFIVLMKSMSEDYPHVTINEFYEIIKCWYRRRRSMVGLEIGPQTMIFGLFFATDPDGFFNHLREHGGDVEGLARFLPKDLVFLRNESLNSDIVGFLRRFGFTEQEVAFIHEHPRILPSGIGRQAGELRDVIDEETLGKIREEESVVYQIYERYGATYDKPRVLSPSLA